MLWIHPVLQVLVTIAAFYVFLLGVQRFRSAHLGHKVAFNWKRHVVMGRWVIIGWLLGLAVGKMAVNAELGMMGIFADHNQGAMIMTPLMLIAYVSGTYMDRRKARRTALPLVHAANNVLLLGVALYQVYTGWLIVDNFLLNG